MKYRYDRLLAAVLSLCLLAGLLAPVVRAEENTPETIQIATAEQLEALARDCRLDSWSEGRIVVVTEDIDLTGSDFAGIPTFGGALEGQGHTIRGLNLTEEGSVQGLFRYLQQDARVQDLHVEGSVQPGGSRAFFTDCRRRVCSAPCCRAETRWWRPDPAQRCRQASSR